MTTRLARRLLTAAAIASTLGLGACPPPPARGPVTGACYTSTNCTPAHNPGPGRAGMPQAQCRAEGNGSWQEMKVGSLGFVTYGPCIAPP